VYGQTAGTFLKAIDQLFGMHCTQFQLANQG
jgi:hypothetical protein